MRTWFLFSTLTVLISGCEKPQFSHRKEFSELEDYAQDYVQQVLDTHYGSPTNMVVWDRLPVRKNLAEGTVVSAAETKLTLELAEPHLNITPDTEVLWVGDASADRPSAWIHKWNAATHTATLEHKLAKLPEAGTKVILGPGQILARGRHLYAVHCQHCHGVAGDGQGPTAEYLNPHPRDYRKGIFKFTVTQAAERACRDDLKRTIRDGIPGTYMPSFKLLADEEMTSIVEYVLWLSMRGETEYMLVKYLSDGYSKRAVAERVAAKKENAETSQSIRQEFIDAVNKPDEIPAELESMIELMVSRWTTAQEPTALIAPKENRVVYDTESIARGRKLYLSADLNCIACHGEAGYGDGPQTYSITKDVETGAENKEPGLFDTWGNRLQPRNLHTGIYRGGRRPIDLYSRVHAGIKGTPMPAFGAKLKDQEIWDIVNFIYSVPFESQEAGAGLEQPPAEPTPAGKEVAVRSVN